MNKSILAIIAILLVSACVAQGKGPAGDEIATTLVARPVFDSGTVPSSISDAEQIVKTNFNAIISNTTLEGRGYSFFPQYAKGETFIEGDTRGGVPLGNSSAIRFIVGVPYVGITDKWKEENQTIYVLTRCVTDVGDIGSTDNNTSSVPGYDPTNNTSSECNPIYIEPSMHYLLIDASGEVLSWGTESSTGGPE